MRVELLGLTVAESLGRSIMRIVLPSEGLGWSIMRIVLLTVGVTQTQWLCGKIIIRDWRAGRYL